MEKIALGLVGPIVSPIISKLENMVFAYFGGDITEEELQHLQNTILPKIKAVLLVAETKNVDVLEPWLMKLKEAAYEAGDVLDMYEYQRLKDQVSSVPKCLKKFKKTARDFAAPFSLKTALKKSMEKLIEISAGIDPFIPLIASFTGQDPTNQQQQQQHDSVSSPTSPVFGRDHERDSIVNMLISASNEPSTSSDQRRIPVLAIYGIEGAGKTTLAQSIYKDSRIEKHFDTNKMWWVHVSRKFDKHAIIIESINKGDQCPRVENFDALQSILKNMLSESKRFFLVLDDVWCLDKELWDQMLIPFNEVGDVGSRILITCAAKEVTSILGVNASLPLAELEDDDYWSIFMHYCGMKKDINDPQIFDIAREIVKNLSKSPLVARIVGSSLKRKPKVGYWKQTLEKGDMLKDTLGYLYWSFEQLPPYLQRCFALCSLYPKGYRIFNINFFVGLWIAQGFVEVPSNNTVTMEDEAMRYFNELLSNSFFQQNHNSYEMHGLLHDLAEKISKNYCFRIEDDRERIPTNVMHLSVVGYKDISSHIPDILKLANLHTFIIVPSSDNNFLYQIHPNDILGVIQQKVFMKFKKLRALHLGRGYNGVLKLDKSIGRLKHLRSFQMGVVNKLPKSLGELYHLQFLVLERSIIDKVPQNLNNLINLRYMGGLNRYMYGCGLGYRYMCGQYVTKFQPDTHDVTALKIPLLSKLKSLQYIDGYKVVSSNGRNNQFGIGQLKNLKEIRGSLSISNLENVKDKAEASEASLKEKKHVESLELQWERSSERDGRMDEEVLQGLEPPPNLRALRLDGYNGVRLPKWTRTDGTLSSDVHLLDLERLHSLEIVNCQSLVQVPSLPSMLGRLVIQGCANLSEVPLLPLGLEELDLEDCGGVVETMLSNLSSCNGENGSSSSSSSIQGWGFVLERLRIARCSILGENDKELCLDKPTCLTRLTITGLTWLTSLLLGPNLTALEHVEIENCENLRSIGNSLMRQDDVDAPGVVIGYLSVAGCPELTSLSNLNCFTSIRVLKVMGCPKLTLIKSGADDSLSPSPSSSSSSSSLQKVTIDDLFLLTALLPQRSECCLNSLWRLTIQNSTQDNPFTAEQEELFQHLSSSLTSLMLASCEGLPSLPANLENLSSLKDLTIWDCPKIESLPNLPASLERVHVRGCHPLLKQKYGNEDSFRGIQFKWR